MKKIRGEKSHGIVPLKFKKPFVGGSPALSPMPLALRRGMKTLVTVRSMFQRRFSFWQAFTSPAMISRCKIDLFFTSVGVFCESESGFVTRDGILEQQFLSRFLGIISSLLRLDFFCLVFYPPFFRSTKCYSGIDSRIFFAFFVPVSGIRIITDLVFWQIRIWAGVGTRSMFINKKLTNLWSEKIPTT
jgi:hypothetical protein